jgi:hypothetical protein
VILALEHADLLTQRQDFEAQTISEVQEGTQPPKETYDEFEHEGNLHGPLVISKVPSNPSIFQGDRFLATHRALGFRTIHILGLFVGESAALTLAGAVIGCGGAKVLYQALALSKIGQFVWADMRLRTETLIFCFALALLVGLFASGVPAYRAARTKLAEALRSVG